MPNNKFQIDMVDAYVDEPVKECMTGMYPDELCSVCPDAKTCPGNFHPRKEDTTCWDCTSKDTCEFAFDAYNTNGDCLAEK